MGRGSVETGGPPLTEREAEIARLVSDGLTNAEIADRLGITFATAKWHVSQVLSKLGVESREAVADRLAQVRDRRSPPTKSWPAWGLAGVLKPLGIAAAVVPVAVVAAGAVAVFAMRGGDDGEAATFLAEATATQTAAAPTLAPGQKPPAPPPVPRRITPEPQPHTCDWQAAQANMNGGPIDHSGCDFSGLNLREHPMMWNMAVLRDANLSEGTFAGTFGDADFSGANLRGAQFVQSVFGGTNFAGADLTGADFTNSILNDGDFTGATCPDGTPASVHGGTCIGTKGLRNMPTTRSFDEGVAMVGKPAPTFSATLADSGATVTLSDFAGKPLVLVWTASWCFEDSRCQDIFDRVNAAAAAHPDVPFLALSLDDTVAEAEADAAARGFAFPVALDDDMATAKAYHIIGPGMYVVVGSDGAIARTLSASGLLDLGVVLSED